ncbi:MAG: cysteine hydrolase [Burkholderiales bacterium]|nr:cysteine hydrolase [Burkholderiales bacterium]
MSEQRESIENSRRQFVTGAASVAAATAATLAAGSANAAAEKTAGAYQIPELAPQWKALDLAKILKYPAAFLSVSQNNSLYLPTGAQAAEKQWERPSLPATVKVAKAARKAGNFKTFAWVGYEVFRESYPQSEFDRVHYESWVKGLESWPADKKTADNDLVAELRALVQPGDLEFNEQALQTAFVGTTLPLDLSRKGIKTIVITGIHTDWCIEGNARAARDAGYLPIVIGDATATQVLGEETNAFRRINNYFAPVISSDTFVKLLQS